MEKLKEAQKLLELLINKTPTSPLRNNLTDINIFLGSGIEELKENHLTIRNLVK
jgi:hypothetical protein